MFDNEKKYYIYKSVQDDNILPLTSKCNLSCIFCSHKQNPSDIEIISIGNLKKEKALELIDYLDSNRPIIIGESATKIIEGEPLLYPHFQEIVKTIRERYHDTEIKITTNANLLKEEMIIFLSKIKNISLNISVNYLDSNLRKKIMGKKCNQNLDKTLKLLNNYEIKYNFSMVALPHIIGYKTIKIEIIEMMKYNPKTIRVFMPGFTKNTVDTLKFNYKKVYDKLYELIKRINIDNDIPVIIEPPRLRNFNKEIIGVIKNSPAAKVNIKYLDQIKKVNNKKVVTRVDAFNKINKFENPILEIKRHNKVFTKKLIKEKGQNSGIILDYDLSLDEIADIKRIIKNNKDKSILFLTSILGYELINYTINSYLKVEDNNVTVEKVKNNYLKGSILSAGLLTNYDVLKFFENISTNSFDLLVLPKIMYDVFNNDLCGNSYKGLEKKLGLEVEII